MEVRNGSCAKIELRNGNRARKEVRNGIFFADPSYIYIVQRLYASVGVTLARIVRLYFWYIKKLTQCASSNTRKFKIQSQKSTNK